MPRLDSFPRRSARRLAAALALVLLPPLARAQTQTVDQVLAAVTQVVQDRAKHIAARVIQQRMGRQLCSGKIELPRAQPQDGSVPPLELWLGGREACREGYLLAPDASSAARRDPNTGVVALCKPNDVFVRTCRAIRRLELPLSDPFLLKSLSRDTLEFLIRVAARDLDEGPYQDSGLVEVGAFLHAALEQVGREKARPGALSPPLLALAARLSPGMRGRTFQDLQGTNAPEALERLLKAKVVDPWVRARCPPFTAGPCTAAFFEGCDPYTRTDDPNRKGRERMFGELFGKTAPLRDGRDAPCDEAFPKPAQAMLLTQCRQARLAHNLYGSLMRARCVHGEQATRSAFRELGYVVSEQGAYRDALDGLKLASTELDTFLDAVQRVDLSDLPREELAAAVRFLGTYAAALDASPKETERFFAALSGDLARAAEKPGLASYAAILHGEALGTESPIKGDDVGALRGATKDLLTLPAFAVVRYHDSLDSLDERGRALFIAGQRAIRSVNRLLQTSSDGASTQRSTYASIGALATFVTDLGDVTEAMAEVIRLSGDSAPVKVAVPSSTSALAGAERAEVFRRAAVALRRGGAALQLAADRDWMGLAIQISDEIGRRGALGNVEEVERSMRFVRVLLSMYQADSVDDAKNIFQSALDDEGSRERRFDGWTWDVAALFGAHGGWQYLRDGGIGSDHVSNAWLAGLSLPFGVQVAGSHWGLLAYPVDLGGYLTATGNPGGSAAQQRASGTVRWDDALRFGVATYVRLSKDVPIVIGAGADLRPHMESPSQWRVYGMVALELPLFAIH